MTTTQRGGPRAMRDDRGQALVMVAITIMALCMAVGLAIDSGQLYIAHRSMQEAADAAAYAGAVVLYEGGSPTDALIAASNDVALNGYGGADVTVRQPADAPFNTPDYVEVIITHKVQTSLVPQEAGFTTVTVRGIAGAERLNNGYAIIALGGTGLGLNIGASANITLHGGGIFVNSTDTGSPGDAQNATSLSQFIINDGYGTDVAGTATGLWPTSGSGLRQNQPQQPDPFAGYPKPSTSGLPVNPAPINGGTTSVSGVYTATLSNTKLCSGVYILKAGMGGDIDVDTTPPCDGKVFLFNTNSNYPNAGGVCTAFSAGGNHPIRLDPMTTPPYAGLLFYQDPVCTVDAVFNGSAFFLTSSGTIYVPNAQFRMTGHASVTGGQIVAKTIDTGNAIIDIAFSAATSAQPKLPRLAR